MGSLLRSLASAAAAGLRVEHPLGGEGRCALVHGFLSPRECEALVQAAEQRGFAGAGADYPPSYRDNDRIVMDDPALAGGLFERLQDCANQAPELGAALREDGWRLAAVNPRLRFCRYRPGTQFRAHQDGVHHQAQAESRLTFMVYLNDDGFTGGETVFYPGRSAAMADRDALLRLRPRQGSLVVFDHSLWHAGAVVGAGTKYVMRSDLMYEPDHAAQPEGPFEPAHRGYVWAMAALGGGRIASAGRDASIRLWDADGAPLARLQGHTQSILGLVAIGPGELVSFSRDRTIRQWNLATGNGRVIGTAGSAVLSAGLLVGGQLAAGDAEGRVTRWTLATGEADALRAHEAWVWALAPLADGGFATASEDGMVKLWPAQGSEARHAIDLQRPLRTLCTWTGPDGRTVAAAGDVDGSVHLLSLHGTPAPLARIAAHDGPVRRVRFEADDVLLTCGEDGTVKRWQLGRRTGVVIGTHGNFATDVMCTGPGRWISCGYDGKISQHRARPPTP